MNAIPWLARGLLAIVSIDLCDLILGSHGIFRRHSSAFEIFVGLIGLVYVVIANIVLWVKP